MKKILWLLLCTLPYLGFSQGVVVPNGAVYQINYQRGGLGADSVMAIPVADTTGAGATWTNYRKIGRIMVNDTDSTLYYHDGVKWKVVGGVDTNSFIQGGNSFGEKAVLGSLDDSLVVISNNGIRIQAGGGIKTEATNRVISSVRRSGLGTDVGHIDSFVVTSQTSGAVFFRAKEVNSRIDPWFYPNGVGVTGITVNAKVPDTGATQAVGFNAFSSGARNTVGFLHNLGFGTGSNNVGVKSFQTTANPGSERYMLYSNTSIKSFLRGNLIVGEDVDDGYKLQVNGDMALKNGQEGPGKILTSSADGKINIVDPGSIVPEGSYIQGGNAFGETAVMGTTDNHPLEIKANDNVALRINPDGSVQYTDGTQMVYKPGTEGPGKILTSSADGTVNIVDPGSILPEGAYIQGGNAFGETAVLGTTDNEALELMVNENAIIRINTDNSVQIVDGTEGDGKVLMSSNDGTISAQSVDSLVNNSRAWVNGVKDFGTTQSILGSTSDTLTIQTGSTNRSVMQADNTGRISFGDILRNGRIGIYFKGNGGPVGQPGITFETALNNSSGTKNSVLFISNTPASVTTHNMLSIAQSTGSTTSSFVGINLENWAAGTANTHYGIHSGNFTSGTNNWFLYSPNPVKSMITGNLLLGGTVDNGYKLQVTGDVSIVNGSEGAGKVLSSSADGKINIVDISSLIGDEVFLQGGNAFGETAILGTTDNEALEIKANDNVALRVNPDATVQYTDGTQGDGKILMSSADGTLSAQSQDSVLKGVWRSGVINSMGTHATLRANADTITIGRAYGSPIMQSVGNRMAFNDIVRGSIDGIRFFGYAPSTGNAGLPITFESRFPSGATGNRVGISFKSIGSPPATPTSISVLGIGGSATAVPTWVGITDENWGNTSATNNYFIRTGTFQPSSTNWFLYTQNPVKSQLPGNLLLNKTVDNGYKLQVGKGGIHVESPDEPEKQLVLTTPFTPGNTADAAGEVGAITWDNDYLYIKTTAGWKRAALSNF